VLLDSRHAGRVWGLEGPLSWLAIALFAAIKGLHLAVFATLAGPLLARPWGGVATAALWTGLERTHGPLGFTWLLVGNAGIDMPLPLRLAPLTGVYGLSFVFLALAGAATFVLLRRPRRHLLYIAPLAALWLLPPRLRPSLPMRRPSACSRRCGRLRRYLRKITTAPCASFPS